MKKFLDIVALFALFSIAFISCSHETRAHWDYKRAEKIFNKKGLEEFEEFVLKKKYIAVRNQEQDKATPLLLAVKNGNLKQIQFFLDRGASLAEKDGKGRDVIDYAINGKSLEVLNQLVEKMPTDYWKQKDEKGVLPCVKFVCNFNILPMFLENVLDKTSEFFVDENGKTLLMYATQNNIDVRLIKILLDKYVGEINKKSNNEWTALMYAARYNPNPAVMESLLMRKADSSPNSVGLTLTMLASCNPNPGVLFTLLKYKNEVNEKTTQGKTALMYACENKQNSSVIKLLIDNGADVNVRDETGKTALLYALENYSEPEPLYVLTAAGAEIDVTDNDGKQVVEYLKENKSLYNTDLKNILTSSKREEKKSEGSSQTLTKEKKNSPQKPELKTQTSVATPQN